MGSWKDYLRLRAAFDDGRLSGLDPSDDIGNCPIETSDKALRESWLNGFLVGRLDVAGSDIGW